MAAETMKEAIEIIVAPFFTQEVEWRIQRSGMKGDKAWAIVVPYITARAVHNRLDEAFDPWGWHTEFSVMEIPGGVSGIICRLHYLDPTPDGKGRGWRWKENGASQTNIEPFKGGLSDAEKRAFEQLGGGRYLYSLSEMFAETAHSSSAKCPIWAKTKDGNVFYWGPPMLPEWAVPGVKKAVQDLSEEVTGGPVDEPIEYPEFDRVIKSFERRPGVAELRGAKLLVKELGWGDDELFQFAKEQGINLREDLTKVGCTKLRDMIKQEKGGA